jgi:hypothetical protein
MGIRLKHGAYDYECRKKKSSWTNGEPCKGGDFSIRAHSLDPYAYYELTRTVQHIEVLRDLMLKRLGTDKIAALTTMAAGFQAQLREKREDLETARRRAVQTRDDALAQQFLHDAEKVREEIQSLEADYADARDQLDDWSAGNAWVDAALDSIRQSVPVENPTEADIRALKYEVRRLLLAASGLYLQVWPTGWRADGKRVTTGWMWAVPPEKASRASPSRPPARL